MAQGRAKSTVAGLMLGAATVVTVYEGRVVLANDSGEVEVAAGQGAQAHEGEVPQRWEHDELTTTGAGTGKADTDWQASVRQQAQTIERLREDNRAQYARVEALQRQVEALGGVVDDPHRGAKRVHEELERCARGSGSLGCSFLDSDQESLLAMAQCGTIKIDFPEFLQVGAVDDGGNMVRGFDGLTAQESAGFLAAARRYRQIHEDKLRQLYRELGGADEIAEQASGPVLTAHIEDLLGDDQNGDAIRRRIARERAGLEEPPEDLTALPVDERYERLRAGIGDAFEQEVARELGPQRARELRAEKDGWSGGRSVYSGECTE